MTLRIHIAPFSGDEMEEAVRRGGGDLTPEPGQADGIIWTNPGDPQGLKDLLQVSDPGWVQLPFAGIESFFAAGTIDEGRTWTCAKGIYGPATAEHAVALILAAARRLHVHARASSWASEARVGSGFGAAERRLRGTTVVVIGTGGIGSALAAMLAPFGARLVGVNRSGRPLMGAAETVRIGDLDRVLPEADFVVLAAAATHETRHLLDRDRLRAMKREAWVVNVARGSLVDTDALVEALREGDIGGAALDVTDPEPLPDDHPLWTEPRAIVTPHVANTWDMAVPELVALVERNVRARIQRRQLEGLVDVAAGY